MSYKVVTLCREDGQFIKLLYTRLPSGDYVHVTTLDFLNELGAFMPFKLQSDNERIEKVKDDHKKWMFDAQERMNESIRLARVEHDQKKFYPYRTKEDAVAFLQFAGILGDDGQLTEPYRS
jgi:hypothetical protein